MHQDPVFAPAPAIVAGERGKGGSALG